MLLTLAGGEREVTVSACGASGSWRYLLRQQAGYSCVLPPRVCWLVLHTSCWNTALPGVCAAGGIAARGSCVGVRERCVGVGRARGIVRCWGGVLDVRCSTRDTGVLWTAVLGVGEGVLGSERCQGYRFVLEGGELCVRGVGEGGSEGGRGRQV